MTDASPSWSRAGDEPPAEGPSRLLLAVGLGLAPAAWVLHFVAGISLVAYACDQGSETALHLTTVVALPLAIVGLVGAVWLRRAVAGTSGRGVLGTVALSLAMLSIALILVEQAVMIPLDPCT